MKNSIIEISLACIQNIGGSLCNCICRSDRVLIVMLGTLKQVLRRGFLRLGVVRNKLSLLEMLLQMMHVKMLVIGWGTKKVFVLP